MRAADPAKLFYADGQSFDQTLGIATSSALTLSLEEGLPSVTRINMELTRPLAHTLRKTVLVNTAHGDVESSGLESMSSLETTPFGPRSIKPCKERTCLVMTTGG